MIALVGASVVSLLALQAAINAPTDAFRGCLRESSTKATNEKVAPDAIDAYLRAACGAQLSTLKSAVVAFRVKNGMSRKSAAEDASMTVDDYLATSVEKYQFMAEFNKPAQPVQAQAPATATPAAQAAPASQPTPAAAPQPPKP